MLDAVYLPLWLFRFTLLFEMVAFSVGKVVRRGLREAEIDMCEKKPSQRLA